MIADPDAPHRTGLLHDSFEHQSGRLVRRVEVNPQERQPRQILVSGIPIIERHRGCRKQPRLALSYQTRIVVSEITIERTAIERTAIERTAIARFILRTVVACSIVFAIRG
jgi:hypothetical protein